MLQLLSYLRGSGLLIDLLDAKTFGKVEEKRKAGRYVYGKRATRNKGNFKGAEKISIAKAKNVELTKY